jgi:hypothetical protein
MTANLDCTRSYWALRRKCPVWLLFTCTGLSRLRSHTRPPLPGEKVEAKVRPLRRSSTLHTGLDSVQAGETLRRCPYPTYANGGKG